MPWKPTKNYKKINGRFTMVRHTMDHTHVEGRGQKIQDEGSLPERIRGAYMFAMRNDHLDEVCEHVTPGPIDMDRLIMNVVRKLR